MTYWDGSRWIPEPSTRPPHPGAVRRLLGAGAEAALITLLLFGLIAGTALAARRSSPTLTVTPNHAEAWSWASGAGCGYGADEVIWIDIIKPEAHAFTAALADSSGCIGFTFSTDGPGTYTVQARQQGKGGNWKVLATYELPVR